ncbi:MAG: alpha-E domain-containing protein [Phycisphaerae bacterium]
MLSPMQALLGVAKYMALDPSNPISLMSCLTKARENARSIRESISNEMWEQLNTLYWSLRTDDAMVQFDDSPQEFFRHVMTGSLLLQGLADQTIDHGQVWLFIQLSKYLERADMTCRILLTKFQTLQRMDTSGDPARRVIQWMAVLRACGAIEAYSRANVGEIDPALVASFILFEPTFPRSVHFSVHHALQAVDRIRAVLAADAGRDAQRRLGRLFAELQYSRAAPTQDRGLLAFLDQVRNSAADASIAVQDQWLMRSGEQASQMEMAMG